MNTTVKAALDAAAQALQCSIIIANLDTKDCNSTGFHVFAAEHLADCAWVAFTAAALSVSEAEIVGYADDAEAKAESAGKILAAYLMRQPDA